MNVPLDRTALCTPATSTPVSTPPASPACWPGVIRPHCTRSRLAVLSRNVIDLRALVLTLALATGITPAFAVPQSQQTSEASAASLNASTRVPAAALEALSTGGQFAVVAVRSSAQGVSVVVRSSANGVSMAVQSTAELVGRAGLAAGSVILVTVVASGYILSGENGDFFAYVPNERALRHIHSREIV